MIDEAHAAAPDHPLAKFRATGISIVRFATAHPEHFRVMCIPGISPHKRSSYDEDRKRIADAQRGGLIASAPTDDVMLAANALVTGLAHLIIEGQLGPVDDKRATELAIAATAVLGVGLIPRDEDVPDELTSTVVGKKRKPRQDEDVPDELTSTVVRGKKRKPR
jgi:hypothetical protein